MICGFNRMLGHSNSSMSKLCQITPNLTDTDTAGMRQGADYVYTETLFLLPGCWGINCQHKESILSAGRWLEEHLPLNCFLSNVYSQTTQSKTVIKSCGGYNDITCFGCNYHNDTWERM